MKRLIIAFLLLTSALSASAQERIEMDDITSLEQVASLKDSDLDSIDVKKKLMINDYTMVGVQYGAGLSRVNWNPRIEQDMVFVPVNFGVTYTRYGKMFGYMPYFGFQAGIFYTKDAYQFKYNEEYDYTYTIEGAEKAIIDVVEVPILFQFHYDMWNFKIMAQVGCYGGYRLGIERFPGKTGHVSDALRHSFKDTDRRMDYGIKGGAGFALVFEPVELHFMASYKHSLATLYEPDYYSEYYYRYAYPQNIVVSVGAHFHITKRTGKTKAEIKKMAREMVYNKGNQ
jgi:hypothetical protein